MPKFEVDFCIQHNGRITIDAETERDARLIVENLDATKLEKHTSSVQVHTFQEDKWKRNEQTNTR